MAKSYSKDYTEIKLSNNEGTPSQAIFYLTIFIVFLGASSAPTPLYPLYQNTWGFSAALLTLVFAVYMFALMASLLFSGSLSDHWGRKPVTKVAIVIEILSMATFIMANSASWLITGRILQGIATGIMTSAVVAAILDSDTKRGPLIASIAPLIAMAFGALFAGVLTNYAPAPMRLVYVIFLVALILQLMWLPKMVETVATDSVARLSLKPRLYIPIKVRTRLILIIPVSIASWMLGGFALSLGPSLVTKVIHLDNSILGALPIAMLSTVGAIVILALRRQSPILSLLVGSWGLIIGMLTIAAGIRFNSSWLLLLGITISGAGFGSGFTGVMRTVTSLITALDRAAIMATLYIIWYLAASIPAIIAGIATDSFGLIPTTYVYIAAITILSFMALIGLGFDTVQKPRPCPNA